MTSAEPLESNNSKVYLEYSLNDLPVHPGGGWTRFICISDTHSKRFELPPGDVLLHSGDLSSGGSVRALKTTIEWLRELDYDHKVIIAGNHDMCLDTAWREGGRLAQYWSISPKEHDAARDLVLGDVSKACGITYLQYDATEITTGSRTWKIWGSPAAPVYSEGAFQYSESSHAKAIYKHIPTDVDILLTHTPAYGILNKTRGGNEAGCRVLAKAMTSLTPCRLHLHGHIHESHGAIIVPANKTGGGQERVVVNGALQKFGMPIIVDLKH